MTEAVVLIVEDDPLIAWDLESLVRERTSAQVLVCGRLVDAFRSLERRPALALMDVNLPDGDSYALASALCDADVPCAFVSGSSPEARPARLRDIAFLHKPLDPRRLQAFLHARRPDLIAQSPPHLA